MPRYIWKSKGPSTQPYCLWYLFLPHVSAAQGCLQAKILLENIRGLYTITLCSSRSNGCRLREWCSVSFEDRTGTNLIISRVSIPCYFFFANKNSVFQTAVFFLRCPYRALWYTYYIKPTKRTAYKLNYIRSAFSLFNCNSYSSYALRNYI